ncbi:MAG: hypothetical protein JWO73_481 [Candidatus Taylorbacteria bacterium]|nr:hypothetical protein [Candidatus Taylorbacteria bacterium]
MLPQISPVLGIVAGCISFSAYVLYMISTVKGRTKPSRSTWWILTLVGIMIASSYYASGARDTIWVALSYVLGPLIISILSLKYGEGKWERLDKWCLASAIISASVWAIFRSAQIALVTNIVMDFLGLIPTIKKSYLRPEGEDRAAWTLESFSGALNIFAIEKWTFSIAFYPLYLLIVNGIVTLFLYMPIIRRKFAKKQSI